MKKNLILTFGFSFIPGAGQMYQNYMKRGLSIMTLAAFFVAIAFLFGLPILLLPVLITEAFSFFDTYRLRNLTDEERKEFKDELVWNTDSMQEIIPNTFKTKKNKCLGIILIVVGLYIIGGYILDEFNTIALMHHICNFYKNKLPVVLISAYCAYIGWKMIKE